MTKKISELTPAEQRELVRLWNDLDQWAAERRAAALRDFIHTRVKQLYSEGRSVEAIAREIAVHYLDGRIEWFPKVEEVAP